LIERHLCQYGTTLNRLKIIFFHTLPNPVITIFLTGKYASGNQAVRLRINVLNLNKPPVCLYRLLKALREIAAANLFAKSHPVGQILPVIKHLLPFINTGKNSGRNDHNLLQHYSFN